MDITFAGIDLTIDESAIGTDPPEVRRQIHEYASGSRRRFDLPVVFPESFTGEVMRAMTAIPYGETRTYGQLATTVESSPIAVGQACGRNPAPIVVPCHRVVGADGLGGFSAGGEQSLALKRALLEHERNPSALPG